MGEVGADRIDCTHTHTHIAGGMTLVSEGLSVLPDETNRKVKVGGPIVNILTPFMVSRIMTHVIQCDVGTEYHLIGGRK